MKYHTACYCVFLSYLLLGAGYVARGADDDPRISGKRLSQWIQQLESSNRGLQARAARALCDAPKEVHPQMLPKIIPLLRAERENTRPWVAQAVGNCGPMARRAVPDLLPLLQGTQYERNRAAGAKALGQVLAGAEPSEEVENVVKEMVRLFDDQYPDVRREALAACGTIGMAAKSCIPHLKKRLNDAAAGTSNARDIGRAAVWTCGQFGKESQMHIDQLISVMHGSPLSDVIDCIGKVGPIHEQVVPNIVDRMEKVASGSVIVREGSRTHRMGSGTIAENMEAGFKALSGFGAASAPGVAFLGFCISEKGWGKGERYAVQALNTLAAIGPAAKEAIPIIEKNCLNSRKPEIKEAAEKTLAVIRGETAAAKDTSE